MFFFFNDTATTEIYTLSLHDALPIYRNQRECRAQSLEKPAQKRVRSCAPRQILLLMRSDADVEDQRSRHPAQCQPEHAADVGARSEEHTSELQSRQYLVCRLLLEKKK